MFHFDVMAKYPNLVFLLRQGRWYINRYMIFKAKMIAQIEHKNATLCQIKSNLKLVHSNVNLKLRCTVVKVSELGYTNVRQCKKNMIVNIQHQNVCFSGDFKTICYFLIPLAIALLVLIE